MIRSRPMPANSLQGTEEWHEQRAMKVTGSRIGAILGHSPWMKREDVMVEFIKAYQGLPREDKSNIAMDWGIEHEPIALRQYEDKTGDLITLEGFMQHPDLDYVGMSPDGITNNRLLEVKCPFSKKIPDEIPDHYYDQVQLGMQVMDLDEAILYYWTPDNDYEFPVIERDHDWWRATLPVINEFLIEFNDRKDQDLVEEVHVIAPEAMELAEQLEACNKTLATFTEMQKEIKAKLMEYVDEEIDTCIGNFKATHVTRKGSVNYAKYVKDNKITIPSDYIKPDTNYIRWSNR